ncbi:MAG: hypothetical protein HUJ98_13710, partial [Bacteroidaceae bacterium]|nr:hypothetical protein [Bacteroidaceae bacterium]
TMTTADMNACFMYAKTTGVDNGTSPVKLGYKPLSTAIRFILRGPNTDQSTVTVSRIRLIGPDNVALSGQFQVKLDGTTPVVTPVSGKTKNEVTIFAQYDNEAYLELATGQSVELNAFIIPINGQKVDHNWKLEVTLSGTNVVTKTLTPASSTDNTVLIAGMIHRLGNMPYLPVEDFNPANWMKYIPRNVYLSEISIPSSWNTLEPSAQDIVSGSTPTQEGINTINDQYSKGCRGFHFDCRYKWTTATEEKQYVKDVIHHNTNGGRTGYCTACHDLGRGYKWHDAAYDENVYGTRTEHNHVELGVVHGKGTVIETSSAYSNKYFMPTNNITFAEAINAITANVKADEYMVLTCTWAHGSTDPISQSTSAENPYKWLHDISAICADNGKVYDASTITANTTVGEVLGNIIVIINCEGAISAHNMPTSSKCLFVNMPQKRTEAMYAPEFMSNEHLYKFDKSQSGVKIANTLAQICS